VLQQNVRNIFTGSCNTWHSNWTLLWYLKEKREGFCVSSDQFCSIPSCSAHWSLSLVPPSMEAPSTSTSCRNFPPVFTGHQCLYHACYCLNKF
jgi:hypothetical protein